MVGRVSLRFDQPPSELTIGMDRESGKKTAPAPVAESADGPPAGGAKESPVLSIDSYVPTLVARLALRLIKSAQEPFKQHNLTIPKFRILLTLAEYPGVKFKRLGQFTRIEAPTLSRVLDNMVADGHIRRRRARDDSRSVKLYPTPKGLALLEAAIPWSVETEQKLLRNLTVSQRNHLIEMLNLMHRNLDEDDGLLDD